MSLAAHKAGYSHAAQRATARRGAGVTFGADEVVSAVVKLDGREIHIIKKEDEPPKFGFAK